jgi:hypothetical protein
MARPPGTNARTAGRRKPVVLGYFKKADAGALVEAVRKASFPSEAEFWIGSYGPSKEVSDLVRSLPNGRYAPMYSIQPGEERPDQNKWPSKFFQGRDERAFTDEQRGKLPKAFSGEIPLQVPGKPLPRERHREWGVELGRRYRDSLHKNKKIPIDGWQFDEVLGEAGNRRLGREMEAHLDFASGILYGLWIGRPNLRDENIFPKAGIIWVAGTAIRNLATLPDSAALRRFLLQLSRSCLWLVGQEYPEFTLEPAAAVQRYSTGQLALAKSPRAPVRALGARYIAGHTPGYERLPGLGGKGRNQATELVPTWRKDFLAKRAALRPTGFAQYAFVKGNAQPRSVDEVARAVATTIRRLA